MKPGLSLGPKSSPDREKHESVAKVMLDGVVNLSVNLQTQSLR